MILTNGSLFGIKSLTKKHKKEENKMATVLEQTVERELKVGSLERLSVIHRRIREMLVLFAEFVGMLLGIYKDEEGHWLHRPLFFLNFFRPQGLTRQHNKASIEIFSQGLREGGRSSYLSDGFHEILRQQIIPAGSSFLDVGVGDGGWMGERLWELPLDQKIGLDLNESLLTTAAQRNGDFGFVKGNALSLPMASGAIGVLTGIFLIDNFDEDELCCFFEEVKRLTNSSSAILLMSMERSLGTFLLTSVATLFQALAKVSAPEEVYEAYKHFHRVTVHTMARTVKVREIKYLVASYGWELHTIKGFPKPSAFVISTNMGDR